MTGSLFAFLALVGIVAAVGFFLSARTARAALAARDAEQQRLAGEAEAARRAEKDARAEAKARREDATHLERELEKAKKKAYEQQEAAKRAGGAAALREELDKLAARLAEARAEAEHQLARAKALEGDLAKSNQALERARTRAVEPPPPPPAPLPQSVTPAAFVTAAPADDALRAELATEKGRADKAEAKLVEARKRMGELEKDVKNVRGRLETEKRVYIVQKGELELAADRYAELRRRHDALRKDHDELVEAVRQAAREDRRLTSAETARAEPPGAGEGGAPEAAGGTTAA
jgi:myosin heavy subunit